MKKLTLILIKVIGWVALVLLGLYLLYLAAIFYLVGYSIQMWLALAGLLAWPFITKVYYRKVLNG